MSAQPHVIVIQAGLDKTWRLRGNGEFVLVWIGLNDAFMWHVTISNVLQQPLQEQFLQVPLIAVSAIGNEQLFPPHLTRLVSAAYDFLFEDGDVTMIYTCQDQTLTTLHFPFWWLVLASLLLGGVS